MADRAVRFVAAAAALAVLAPGCRREAPPAPADEPRPYAIAIFQSVDSPTGSEVRRGILQAFAEAGLRDGRDIVVSIRIANNDLAEVQRITSEGDYEAAKALIETYGVQVDPDLHREVLDRYAKLDLAPYSGFVNPVYTPVVEDGRIVDVKIDLTEGYVEQMLRYGRDYSFLR